MRGLYQALTARPASPEELAARTQTSPRYIAEWLGGQAAGGYVEYDPATGTYSMTEEQAFALANPDGEVYALGRSCSRSAVFGACMCSAALRVSPHR